MQYVVEAVGSGRPNQCDCLRPARRASASAAEPGTRSRKRTRRLASGARRGELARPAAATNFRRGTRSFTVASPHALFSLRPRTARTLDMPSTSQVGLIAGGAVAAYFLYAARQNRLREEQRQRQFYGGAGTALSRQPASYGAYYEEQRHRQLQDDGAAPPPPLPPRTVDLYGASYAAQQQRFADSSVHARDASSPPPPSHETLESNRDIIMGVSVAGDRAPPPRRGALTYKRARRCRRAHRRRSQALSASARPNPRCCWELRNPCRAGRLARARAAAGRGLPLQRWRLLASRSPSPTPLGHDPAGGALPRRRVCAWRTCSR